MIQCCIPVDRQMKSSAVHHIQYSIQKWQLWFGSYMTLKNRHQQCHPEVNLVWKSLHWTLRGNKSQGGKQGENIGGSGGKRRQAGMQASSSLIVSSISVLPALVTSRACSHAARCLLWIIETTLCPVQSSLLNSPPRHSDTLRSRRDSFTLTHRNMVCRGLWGCKLSAGTNRSTEEGGGSLLCSTNTTPWPGSRSVELKPSSGLSFYWGEMLS